MKNKFPCFFKCLMLSTMALSCEIGAATTRISDSSPVILSGHIPTKAIAKATFINHLNANAQVPLTFVLPLRNKAALEELVQRMYDPTDHAHYGKYLTGTEFVEQFAPTQEDYNAIVAYVTSLGMTVTGSHSNRTLLNVSGSIKSIETAFNLLFHQYQKSNGQLFYAPSNDPEMPSSIASIIKCIAGLDNQVKRHTHYRQKHTREKIVASNEASNTSPSGPGGGYSPNDLLDAYNLSGLSANGSGQIIALFELAGYLASDINEYTSYFGLPSPKLQNILIDGGSESGIDPEVTLDIELALALAPGSHIYVYEGPNSDQGVLDTYNRIATDNLAKQVSTSWGAGEDTANTQILQAEDAIFLQMAAQGQTIYAAAGDSGAYDNFPSRALVVDDPASQPYVIGVGGTTLAVNPESGAYSSESVWDSGLGRGAGGGGVSAVWPLPSWQTNVSTVFSKTHRNVPDVSLNADPNTGYAIFYQGKWTIYGGTSCAAPLWAAFTARINQERAAGQKPYLGFANPLFYALGLGSSYTDNFHDVTTGDNLFYSAGVGYDNASGWGSFNGANLFASLTGFLPPAPPPPPPPSIPLSPSLGITMHHPAPFIRGTTGTYTIEVSNYGNTSTSGAVTVVVILPHGMTYNLFSGTGWDLKPNTNIYTHNSQMEPGTSYPLLRVIVNVGEDTPDSVIPQAAVSGGGSSSTKTTTNLTTVRDPS